MPKSMQSQQQQLLEQAAEWLVLLGSDPSNQQTQQDYQQWLQQSAAHRAAAEQMQKMVDKLKTIRHTTAHQGTTGIIQQALNEPVSFKILPKFPLLLLVFCSILMLSIAAHLLPMQYWLAEHRSRHDVWRLDQLPDHSKINISGMSAYNLDFNAKRRQVELLEGNIWVDVAKDAQRPFIIQTKYAAIQALGTRFIVHQSQHYTILTMLHSKVRLRFAHTSLDVHAGQQVVIDQHGLRSIQQIDPKVVEQAWSRRSLAVENMPLDLVLSIVDSYHPDYFYYSKSKMARLKITAVLPLDRDADAMYLLSESLPIAIHQPLPFIRYVAQSAAH